MDGEKKGKNHLRILALGGITGPLVFSAVVIISATWQDDYSHIHNFISEMGATGVPHAAFMNYAGFIPGGLLLAGFGVALGMALPTHRSSIAGAILVAVFGLGIAACGIFSCDPGCPLGDCTLENTIHNVIAPACFVCQIAGMITLGFLFRRLPEWTQRGLRPQPTVRRTSSSTSLSVAETVARLSESSPSGVFGVRRLVTAFTFIPRGSQVKIRMRSRFRRLALR